MNDFFVDLICNQSIKFLLITDQVQFMCYPSLHALHVTKGLNWSSHEFRFNEVELFTFNFSTLSLTKLNHSGCLKQFNVSLFHLLMIEQKLKKSYLRFLWPTYERRGVLSWLYFLICRLFIMLFVRPSVPLQVEVFGQGSFWWSWSPINLKLGTHVPYDTCMIFLILMSN